MRVVIAGGGISGLTAAYLARAAGHEAVCVDPAEQAGGLIRSERHQGFLCEVGPQAVLDGAADTISLVRSVGLEPRALPASTEAGRRFIFARGRLHPLPLSPPALLRSRLLSPGAKLRLLAEPLIPRRPAAGNDDQETVEAFGTRRLGRQAARTLLGTAVIGIYAADAATLSAASAFPRLAAMEREHGSLLRGMLASRKAGRRGPGRPLSFPDGLGELPAALEAALGPTGRLRTRVVAIEPAASGRWRVVLEKGGRLESDAVVLAVPADVAAPLLTPLLPAAGAALQGIPTAPIVVCCLGFRNASPESMGMDLGAYGFLVARGQGPLMLGCQFESSTFAGRAPAGAVLLRALLGGVGPGFEPHIAEQTDEEIGARALADLAAVAGLKQQPDLVRIWRHPRGIPLYVPGHAARVSAIDAALQSRRGLFVIGHGLRGVGVNESIRAATALVNYGFKEMGVPSPSAG